jgi:hypothetical protein
MNKINYLAPTPKFNQLKVVASTEINMLVVSEALCNLWDKALAKAQVASPTVLLNIVEIGANKMLPIIEEPITIVPAIPKPRKNKLILKGYFNV